MNLNELKKIKEKLLNCGGNDAIIKQHSKNKYTARERIEKLFDKGTFVELGIFVKHRVTNSSMGNKELPADGVITGYGQINGRLVYASSQDFTVVGGALGEMHANKIIKCQELAMKVGAPMIYINDSGGARIQEGIDAMSGYGRIFYNNTMASGVIPQISVILGSCAGGAAYGPAITDFIFMVENISHMFITGPQVIKNVTGEDVTMEDLGGAMVHNHVSGVAHFNSDNEDVCIEKVRDLLTYLPQNNLEKTETFTCNDDFNRVCPELNDIIPDNFNNAYDMKNVIKSIADNNIFFEIQSEFAKNIIIGFIRLGGRVIGVVANQPLEMSGCIDINASDKAARFIRTCDCFNIPIVTFEDAPGFLPGAEQEHGGIIRHGSKLMFAYSEASVPMITVITRKAFGGAYIGMGSKHLGVDIVYAWPSAKVAIMGAESAVGIIYEDEIKSSADPKEERNKKISEYENEMMNPLFAASRGYIDDIIEPSTTRKMLIAAFDSIATKVIQKPKKKHGNIPL